jgi:MYXO-CTERM domain-containing protein
MRRSPSWLFLGALAAPLLLLTSSARAEGPCGAFELSAQGTLSCELVTTGGCDAECTPPNFKFACDGQCNVSIDAGCTASCEADCSAECTVDPGSFECEGSCTATCEAGCETQCGPGGAAPDPDYCLTTCKGKCSSECNVQCQATPPTADCTAKCEASCSGSCQVEADVDCNIGCEADLEGGCKVQCEEPSGAIFCNGQYVDATDVEACIAYLAENFSINLSGSIECTGTECVAQVGCGACMTAPSSSGSPLDLAALGAGALGVAAVIARRRRRS